MTSNGLVSSVRGENRSNGNGISSGRELKASQDFLVSEIQRLKQDLNANFAKLNYANELRTIDQRTLNAFKDKFQELGQILLDVRTRETNAHQLVQVTVRF